MILSNQSKNFASWLQSVEEFDYIVDGANIAYSRQNFDDGKFSFQQVENHVEL
jgi:hypothetical protein